MISTILEEAPARKKRYGLTGGHLYARLTHTAGLIARTKGRSHKVAGGWRGNRTRFSNQSILVRRISVLRKLFETRRWSYNIAGKPAFTLSKSRSISHDGSLMPWSGRSSSFSFRHLARTRIFIRTNPTSVSVMYVGGARAYLAKRNPGISTVLRRDLSSASHGKRFTKCRVCR